MAVVKSGASVDQWTIDPTSKAGRVSLYAADGTILLSDPSARLEVAPRPPAFGSLGSYRINALTGALAATLAANASLFSLRWTDATRFALIEYIRASAVVNADITTMVPMSLEAIVARGFSASDSSGTALTISTNNAKMKTSMGGTLIAAGDLRISGTAALTAGTRTLDAQGIGGVAYGPPAGVAAIKAGSLLLPKTPLYEWRAGEGFPLYLAQNEGLVVRNPDAGPATGSFKVMVEIGWTEVASYA